MTTPISVYKDLLGNPASDWLDAAVEDADYARAFHVAANTPALAFNILTSPRACSSILASNAGRALFWDSVQFRAHLKRTEVLQALALSNNCSKYTGSAQSLSVQKPALVFYRKSGAPAATSLNTVDSVLSEGVDTSFRQDEGGIYRGIFFTTLTASAGSNSIEVRYIAKTV